MWEILRVIYCLAKLSHTLARYGKEWYAIRFAYEATDKIIRFTDYKDIKYRSRTVFSFHRPETLRDLLRQPDTIRNNMKHFPPLDTNGFRKCQILMIQQFAFKVKCFRITVQSLKIKFIPEHHIPVFIKDGNQMKFIIRKREKNYSIAATAVLTRRMERN